MAVNTRKTGWNGYTVTPQVQPQSAYQSPVDAMPQANPNAPTLPVETRSPLPPGTYTPPTDPTNPPPDFPPYGSATGAYPVSTIGDGAAAAPSSAPAESAPAAASSANGWWNDPNVDPFAAVGGGDFVDGVWYPKAMGKTSSGGSSSGGTGTTAPPNMQDLSRDAIIQLLQTPQNLSPEELAKTPENRAFQLQAQRAEERQRAQLAERASAEGWSDSGGMETQLQGLRSERGESEAGFLGQLAIDRMQANREQLLAGIQFAQQSGQFDKQQQLQRDLAQLDASIRQAQLAQQDKQFGLSLGYNYAALQAELNRQALAAAL